MGYFAAHKTGTSPGGTAARTPRKHRLKPPGWRTLIAGAATLALAAGTGAQSTIGLLGSRPGATRLPVPVNDRISASVDVGTGNLMVSITALTLPGISSDVPLGAVYNSRSADTTGTDPAPRWTLALGSAGSLSSTSTGVLYTAGDGYSALFTPVSGSTTAFTAPAGVKADLVKTASGYTLTSRTTAEVTTFDADGNTVQTADRNGNATVLTRTAGDVTSIAATRGVTAARTATLTYDSLNGKLSGFTRPAGPPPGPCPSGTTSTRT